MQFIETVKELNVFQAKHHAVSAMIWLCSFLIAGLVFYPRQWADLPMLVLALLGLAYLAFGSLSHIVDVLTKRMTAGDDAVTWQVDVNGVNVGILSDARYAAISHQVFLDVRTYVAQLFNIANALYRVFDALFLTIPICVFWLGFACFYFDPPAFSSILAGLQKVTPVQIISSLPTILNALIVFSIMLIAVPGAVGVNPFGFINHFDKEINKRIRYAMGCSSEGNAHLSLSTGDKMIIPNEAEHIRPQKTA